MTEDAINTLSKRVKIDKNIIIMYYQKKLFNNIEDGETFFKNEYSGTPAQPFIKWAGGKRQILKKLEEHFPQSFNNYYEPFLGGGSVYLFLKNNSFIKNKSYLGDYNTELINTYNEVKNNPKELIKHLKYFRKNNSKEFYYEVREWDRRGTFKRRSLSKRAGRFIFLNKTCYNGIRRVNSKGEHNVPYGKNNNQSIFNEENIFSCSYSFNKETYFKNSDYKETLKNAKKGDFVFLDPPYDPIDKTANFTSYNGFQFTREMQLELLEEFKRLDSLGCKIIMTNSNTDFIRESYKNYIEKYGKILIGVKRLINCKKDRRAKVEEIIIKNF